MLDLGLYHAYSSIGWRVLSWTSRLPPIALSVIVGKYFLHQSTLLITIG